MSGKSAIYRQLEAQWAKGIPAVLDGATGSELQAMGYPPPDAVSTGQNFTWGSMALYEQPEISSAVNKVYVEAGAQIVETNTFMFHRLWRMDHDGDPGFKGTWQDKAKLAVRLARAGAKQGGNPNAAVVFSLMISDSPRTEWMYNGPTARRTRQPFERQFVPESFLRELGQVLQDEPPEAILVELAPDIPADLNLWYYDALLSSDIPLWLSYRRGGHGRRYGIFGDELPDDAELFGRAVAKLSGLGVSAFLGMCTRADRLKGYVSFMRQFTQAPLGVYPNNGQYDMWEWHWENVMSPQEFGAHARDFIKEGANIIGGCCGSRPADIAEVAKVVKAVAAAKA